MRLTRNTLRGYIQLTGRVNYERWSKKLGIDLVSNPDLAAQPKYALPVLVISMRDGITTGRKLSTYIRPGKVDYYNARRVVNALDRASLIAGYARTWFSKLNSLGYPQAIASAGGGNTQQTQQSSNASSGTAQSTSAQNTQGQIPRASDVIKNLKDPNAEVKELDLSQGVVINIELGFNDTELTEYQYLLTQIRGEYGSPHTTKIGGKQLRFAIAKGRRKYIVHRNASVKQIATKIAQSIGAGIEIEDNEDTNKILPNIRQQESDYNFLLKLANQAGLFVRGDTKTLKLKTLKSSNEKITLSKRYLLPGSFWGENASTDRVLVETEADKKKAEKDQKKAEDKTTAETRQKAIEQAVEQAASKEDTQTVSEGTKQAVKKNQRTLGDISQFSKSVLPTLAENVKNTQASGIQELSKGFDSKKGIGKGFEGRLNVNAQLFPSILRVQPGQKVALDDSLELGESVRREYRISGVKHSYGGSGIQSSLLIYLPVAVRRRSTAIAAGNTAGTTNPTSTNKVPFTGEFATTPKRGDVIAGFRVSSPWGPRKSPGGIGSRNHKGTDLVMPNGTPLYCFGKPGEKITVYRRNQPSGAGLYAYFYSQGYTHYLMHCQSVNPGTYTIGADGQGPEIAKSNNTGSSTGPHLHYGQSPGQTPFSGYIPPHRGFIHAGVTGKLPQSS